MPVYNIQYNIHNRYEQKVKNAHYQLLVLPCKNENQLLQEVEITCSASKSAHYATNLFGFTSLQYTLLTPVNEFWFKLKLTINVTETNPYNFLTPEKNEVNSILNNLSFKIENSIFLRKTPLTELYANKASYPALNKTEAFNYLQKLNSFIFDTMKYEEGVTNTETSAQEAFRIKKGVCQDFTHIFIAISRTNGIPCRYVSGYLNQGDSLIGSGQTHAWVEAYIPLIGWIGFDPTNNLLVNHHYIKIAHGTDYSDCSPIVGVLNSGGNQNNTHQVKVINQQ